MLCLPDIVYCIPDIMSSKHYLSSQYQLSSGEETSAGHERVDQAGEQTTRGVHQQQCRVPQSPTAAQRLAGGPYSMSGSRPDMARSVPAVRA